ncbi:hypothetical protein BBK82_06380 [Lentzea guizhouensis]|uniref:Major facilitator superfamily (MFS) profile domain-containing protein n=1 Tax=Lentzea guizhouensis TaxID=1586287 RepID=A0A1B2HDG3_9PSEU|nr:hypothetical protein BBK82_06380 [Lentzea guizhouensis]
MFFLAFAAALGTSTSYPLYPAVAAVADSLGTQLTAVGLALAAGPAGYLAGLGLLVPLVDRFPPARVLAAQFAVLALVLAASAVAGNVVLAAHRCGRACSAVARASARWRAASHRRTAAPPSSAS